ncbi:VIR protein [Plasmodium vivax]|uniref:VIR protein n=1 Tax=Plasmodium vivax TaxID=5855 RepID=A0A1G4EDU2_PLAVI|nr:VIR protein [Plasmodium vivax]
MYTLLIMEKKKYTYQKYGGNYCFNKYSAIITEIEKEIDKFNKIQHTDFYREWTKLNKTIKHRNDDIKDYIAKKHIRNDLYAIDTINNFSRRCLNPRAQTCRNSSTSQDKKSPALKRLGAAGSCTAGKNCNKETPGKREEKSRLPSGVQAGDPKRTSSPRQHPKDQGPQQPTAKEPINTRVISQAPPITTHTAPLVVEVEVSEDKVHLDSITSEQDEAQKEHLTISVSSKVNAEETPPKDHSVQTVINHVSATGHSPGVMDLDKITLQGRLPGNETFDGHLPCHQHISYQDLPRNDGNDQAVSSNIRDTSFMTAGLSLGENPFERDHVDVSAKGVDLVSATSSEQTGEETNTETVSDVVSTINSEDSEIKNSRDANFSNADTDNQASPDKTLCTEGSVDNVLSSGAHFNAEQVGELTYDQSDIFGKVINAIQDNPQIIKTSMPIGIALLLGLLFKFTPLWRVLTKKNRKKGADINEELNSVLQEPSIMDDERSIPFSYGAFEYSSFDQNSY